MKRSTGFTIATILTGAVVGYYFTTYHKWGATWLHVPVFVYGFVGAIVVWIILSNLQWFSYVRYGSSPWMMSMPLIGIFLSIFLGIRFTEPKKEDAWQTTPAGQQYVYAYNRTPAGRVWYNMRGADVGDVGDVGSVDVGDDSGEAIAYVFIAVIILALLIGSAIFPHFWVFATITMLAIALRIITREREAEEYEVTRRQESRNRYS